MTILSRGKLFMVVHSTINVFPCMNDSKLLYSLYSLVNGNMPVQASGRFWGARESI